MPQQPVVQPQVQQPAAQTPPPIIGGSIIDTNITGNLGGGPQ